uniref:Uncharacterized protein n=1 Tax=Sipha flava TaxID=143950 RepID=A0A2S2Q7Q6_9HEMI
MRSSSYIPLPAIIDRKKGAINPQNVDQKCFKWTILVKRVTEQPRYRIGENYSKHDNKYNFNSISFPIPLSDISKFEKNNSHVSVNVYGLEKKFQPPSKYLTYEMYPLRVVNDEKPDHFGLLLVIDDSGWHYVFISNTSMSRLIRSQKTAHNGGLYSVNGASQGLIVDFINIS